MTIPLNILQDTAKEKWDILAAHLCSAVQQCARLPHPNQAENRLQRLL